MRRRCFYALPWAALSVGLASPLSVFANETGKPVRELSWPMLIPRDWSPGLRADGRSLKDLDDNDPKAQQFLKEMRAAFDNAPTVAELQGQNVKLPGYVVPLEQGKDGLTEFLLVPYFGACIHSPPPPANQIVHVTSRKPQKAFEMFTPVWISGTLSTGRRSNADMGVSGYAMELSQMQVYRQR